MKYLFFDLECSNCYGGIGKVCEFGAVLTDENFNVIKSYDIPMNPGNGRNYKFDKGIFKRDPEFGYAYDYEYYWSQPEFPKFYLQIKRLMEDDDIKVFGYAVYNDINYLNSACNRYNLDQIQYVAYDVQKIKMLYSNIKQEKRGLKGAFIELCGGNELVHIQPHLSRDDAKMTMMILKEICNRTGYSPMEICELWEESKFSSVDRKIKKVSGSSTNKKVKSEMQILWGDFYRKYIGNINESSFIGKKVTISSIFKKDNFLLESVIKLIVEKELIPVDQISKSDYLVTFDDMDTERMKGCLKHPYEGKFITYKELEVLC